MLVSHFFYICFMYKYVKPPVAGAAVRSTARILVYITQTRACNMHRFLKAVKMIIFRMKKFFSSYFLLKT